MDGVQTTADAVVVWSNIRGTHAPQVNGAEIVRALRGTWSGRKGRACCPAHHDSNASLEVDDKDGKTLVYCQAGCSQEEVIRELINLGLWRNGDDYRPSSNNDANGNEQKTPIIPVPLSAPRMTFKHPVLGAPVATWPYHAIDGSLVGYSARFNTTNKDGEPDKTFLPITYCDLGDGKCGWRSKGIPTPRPLYRLPKVVARTDVPILVTEGEKSAEAAQKLFPGFVATSPMHGAKSPAKTDWSPVSGRQVVIWPDADEPGRKFADAVALLARNAGAIDVRIVDVPESFPEGWDLADHAPEGWTTAKIVELLKRKANGSGGHPEEQRRKTEEPDDDQRTTEDAIALSFAEKHSHRLRFISKWGIWKHWNGKVWESDDTLFAYDLARKECRAARKALPTNTPPKIHAILASAKTVNAVTQLSRTDRRIAATHEQWDTNLETLNTPGGIVDLCTGIILPHNPLDYCTKITSVAPAPVGTKCPIWTSFLSKIMQGEEEIIQFLQRVVGYALTGLTIEHAMFFLYGKGANGKGTFLNALTTILGDYATVAPIDTFTASTSERHPTDLAMLRGARLVASQETDEGRRWAEAKIKALTGGDPISARFMRQDFFTYFPQFKLLVAGNHKPALQGVDEAIRRRLNLIPFTFTVPEADRDVQLPEKLKPEYPAILRWAIDGTLLWRKLGLAAPKSVRVATDDYLAAEDTFGAWLAERTKPSSFGREDTADLFASWRKYCERTGEQPGTEKKFRGKMDGRFTPKHHPVTRRAGFEGIELVRADYSDDPRYGG